MKAKRKQSGITLMEMTVVVAAVALLAVLGLPAIHAFFNSLESKGPAEAMINAALSSARAIAIKERHYAGVRFQKVYDPKGPLKASQYMILIVQDPSLTGTYGYGFRTVRGLEPVKLPDSIGVMDLTIVPDRNEQNPVNPTSQIRIDIVGDTAIDTDVKLIDTTTFSIIFSPSGKLVIHGVRVWNKDGGAGNSSQDDVFNTLYNVETARIAMFLQDDYWTDPTNFGLGPEPSRNSFVIYERDKFKAAFENGRAWSDYLENLASIYINPYTGTIIEQGQ